MDAFRSGMHHSGGMCEGVGSIDSKLSNRSLERGRKMVRNTSMQSWRNLLYSWL